jgi:hypothetical protein
VRDMKMYESHSQQNSQSTVLLKKVFTIFSSYSSGKGLKSRIYRNSKNSPQGINTPMKK